MMEYVDLFKVVIILSVGLIAGSHWCFKDAFDKPNDKTNMLKNKNGSA